MVWSAHRQAGGQRRVRDAGGAKPEASQEPGNRGRRPNPWTPTAGHQPPGPSGLTAGEGKRGEPDPDASFFPTPPPIGFRTCRPTLRASRLPPQTATAPFGSPP